MGLKDKRILYDWLWKKPSRIPASNIFLKFPPENSTKIAVFPQ